MRRLPSSPLVMVLALSGACRAPSLAPVVDGGPRLFSQKAKAPADAVEVGLDGEALRLDGGLVAASALPAGPLLLAPVGDTYLAQVAAALAALDDAHAEVWLRHPDGRNAFRLVLKDEPAFGAWIDEPVPGKIRVIQRSDGFELVSNLGKLPGPDRNGPTVPIAAGRLDVAALREGLNRLKLRFRDAPDFCLVPSFGTELSQVARVLEAAYHPDGDSLFPATCLVYPRPRSATRDGGAGSTP